jgi:succinate dehydrogenase / fumarate reductase flavoprotein subunit
VQDHDRLLGNKGKRTPSASFHKQLGKIMWEHCGMARTKAGLEEGHQGNPALREEFWKERQRAGEGREWNQSLERAGRVADFIELGELMCRDALDREESCGGHFREEYQYTRRETSSESAT